MRCCVFAARAAELLCGLVAATVVVAASAAPAQVPGHSVVQIEGMLTRQGAVSAAPFGSASILTISWMYLAMLGGAGVNAGVGSYPSRKGIILVTSDSFT